jgi:phosphotransferase system enzyme I (PtsP)
VFAPRELFARLRETMEHGAPTLDELIGIVADETHAEVCSVYVRRPGDLLELAATRGLRASAVGRTRLRVGEGIIGLSAAKGEVMNLADAQNHPRFVYRPETGEEPFASLLAVPVRRGGRTVGVLAIQNREPSIYDAVEVEVMQTVAMLLAEVLASAGGTETSEQGVAATLPRRFAAIALVPGIAVGPVILHGRRPRVRRLLAEDTDAEFARLQAAVTRMQTELDRLIAARLPDGDGPRGVLEAYRLIAADAGWLKRVADAVHGGLSAEAAIQRVTGELRDRMRRVADPYLRERLADLEDLSGRLLAALDGSDPPAAVPPGAILFARRLGPADLLDWHARGVAGFAIEEASGAGHAAILARALGIPAVGGVRGLMDAADEGDEAVLDGDDAQVILRPETELRRAYDHVIAQRTAMMADRSLLRDRPATTADGVPLTLMLNAGLALELDQLDLTGAAGIGLFRTEIAMLARGSVVDLDEQAEIYTRVLEAADGRPVVFRTLDLGGDKMLPGADSADEENPAMGWRSIRIGLDRPAVLLRQLRALLRAAAGRELTVMFPMIATVAEFRTAKALLLAEAGRAQPGPAHLRIGTMLEVPALLWQLRELLAHVDFISVGSNDLLQFLFAADRGTPSLSGRYDLLSPAVFDMLDYLLARAGEAGVPVSLCGEAAGRPIEALALVGLGLTTLSMPASGVAPVRALLNSVTMREFRCVLASMRRHAGSAASLRGPLLVWAREAGLDV